AELHRAELRRQPLQRVSVRRDRRRLPMTQPLLTLEPRRLVLAERDRLRLLPSLLLDLDEPITQLGFNVAATEEPLRADRFHHGLTGRVRVLDPPDAPALALPENDRPLLPTASHCRLPEQASQTRSDPRARRRDRHTDRRHAGDGRRRQQPGRAGRWTRPGPS